MYRTVLLTAVLGLLTVSAAEQKDTSEKVFHGAAGGRLTIENVIGSISVTAVAGHEVRVTMTRSIKGRGPDDIAQAQREVVLESSDDGGNVRFHVRFPSEDNCGKDGCADGRHDRHYTVSYEFRVQAPPGMLLKLSTVTAGDITVHGAFGDFDVNNVNGGIEMSDIAGSGEAHTVNGRVRVDFAKNPTGPSSFKSINGELRVTFQPGLSADVQLKTFNGEAWTDFDSDSLPPEGGHWTGKLYSKDRATGIRIGHGGPAINFEAFNGNIYILNRGKKS
jgi:hypothetical protein